MDKVINPKFVLYRAIHPTRRSSLSRRWLVVSSADLAAWTSLYDLEYHVSKGSFNTKSFGQSHRAPEQLILTVSKIENHGYFKHLRDIRDYVRMEELLDV